jgi:hypothetical protein
LREAAFRTDPKERSKRAFACLLLCVVLVFGVRRETGKE